MIEAGSKIINFDVANPDLNRFPVIPESDFSPPGMEGEYSLQPFNFEIGSENGSGTIFDIKPHRSTRVVRVDTEGSIARDFPVSGSGWFLIHKVETGKVECCPTDIESSDEIFTYGRGDIIVWIAGDQGLKVVNIFTPPFSSDAETIVEIDNPCVPPDFWETYHSLKTK